MTNHGRIYSKTRLSDHIDYGTCFLYPPSFHLSSWSFTDRETSEESIYWILTQSVPEAYSLQWMLPLSCCLNNHALCTAVATGSLAQKCPWVRLKLNRCAEPASFHLFTHLWVSMYASATITFYHGIDKNRVSCVWLTSNLIYLAKKYTCHRVS